MSRWIFVLAIFSSMASALDYDTFAAKIRATGAKSVEAALDLVPRRHWERYTLFHTSRSVQPASPLFPRVVLFGEDASFVLAYNGDPAQPGYDTLEMIQWRDDQREFEFRQIRFPSPKNTLTEPKFSDANPTSCRTCHRQQPRPNWDPYSVWAGAYGERDDVPRDNEKRNYLEFRRRNASLERYRRLVVDGRDISPYEDVDFGKPSRRPNLLLTQLFARRNATRIAYRILRHDDEKLTASRAVLECGGSFTELAKKLGLPPSEWGLRFIAPGQPAPTNEYYFEGFHEVKQLVRYAMYRELVAKFPELEGKATALPYYYSSASYSQEDRDYVKAIPRLGGVLDFGNQGLCQEVDRAISRARTSGHSSTRME